jgi:hypothetical protein
LLQGGPACPPYLLLGFPHHPLPPLRLRRHGPRAHDRLPR